MVLVKEQNFSGVNVKMYEALREEGSGGIRLVKRKGLREGDGVEGFPQAETGGPGKDERVISKKRKAGAPDVGGRDAGVSGR